MAFTYKGMITAVAAATVNGDPVSQITANNVRPLLVLWLLAVTNGTFWDDALDARFPPLDDTQRADIANQLGLTKPTVDFVFNTALDPANIGAFRQVARAFKAIGYNGDYSDVFCTATYQQVLSLAPSAQVKDPNQ